MKPLRKATVVSTEGGRIALAFEGGWTCAVSIVAEGVGRVLFTPPDGLREPRTWAIAPTTPHPSPLPQGERGGAFRSPRRKILRKPLVNQPFKA